MNDEIKRTGRAADYVFGATLIIIALELAVFAGIVYVVHRYFHP